MGNESAAQIAFVAGMTGTGKTQWILRQVARPKRRRLMVWSPKEAIDNYGARFRAPVVRTAAELLALVKTAGSRPFAVVFAPPAGRKPATALFDLFCRVARAARNVTVIVDELHTVTLPSWAPDGWSELTLMGRGFGIEIFAASQRPAGCDKDFFGNCSLYHSGRLGFDEDAKVMGRLLKVPPAELLSLPDMHYIEREPRAMGEARRGVVKWMG